MLSTIRTIADSFLARLFLALIALSFIMWGVKEVLQGGNDKDIVVFSKAKNITNSEFLRAKSEEIKKIGRSEGVNLSEDQIKDQKIDSFVLAKLINERLLQYVHQYFDLGISDDLTVEILKKTGDFKNSEKQFDINIFNSTFRNHYQRDQYLVSTKENILRTVVENIFTAGLKPPKILIDNIVNYIAEIRNIDLVTFDIKESIEDKDFIIPAASDSELEQFYNDNIKLFSSKETRQYEYIVIPFTKIEQQIKLSEADIKQYYEENIGEFKGKSLKENMALAHEILLKERLEQEVYELLKKLEDEVATGSTLAEISLKYDYPIKQAVATKENEDNIKNLNEKQFSEIIFEMSEGEISYPVDNNIEKTISIVYLSKINWAVTPRFVDIKPQVIEMRNKQIVILNNIKNFESLANHYKPNDLSLLEFKNNTNIKIKKSINISRANNKEEIPMELLELIFQSPLKKNTPIIKSNNKVYFAFINDIKVDENKVKEIKENSLVNIETTLKYSSIEELIGYFAKYNKIKINYVERK